jgi:hypothetical protein
MFVALFDGQVAAARLHRIAEYVKQAAEVAKHVKKYGWRFDPVAAWFSPKAMREKSARRSPRRASVTGLSVARANFVPSRRKIRRLRHGERKRRIDAGKPTFRPSTKVMAPET